MPTLANSELLVKAGALIGVTASYQSIGRQAAQVSSQILNGDKSMYGSVLQPDEAQVIVNVDTKEQIGLEIDPIVRTLQTKQSPISSFSPRCIQIHSSPDEAS